MTTVIARRVTPTQARILALVARGYTHKEIAKALQRSPHTVHHNLTKAFVRLGAASAPHAVWLAVSSGVIEPYRDQQEKEAA